MSLKPNTASHSSASRYAMQMGSKITALAGEACRTRGLPSRGQLGVWDWPLRGKHNLTEEEANRLSGAEEDGGKEQTLSDEPGIRMSSLHS